MCCNVPWWCRQAQTGLGYSCGGTLGDARHSARPVGPAETRVGPNCVRRVRACRRAPRRLHQPSLLGIPHRPRSAAPCFICLPQSTSVQFLVIGNTFNTNGVTDATAAVTAAFSSNGTISLTLRGNQFTGNAAASVQNETVCVSNSAVARRAPRLSLAGNQGVEPSKPARNVVPW